jgi:hypothetical protein
MSLEALKMNRYLYKAVPEPVKDGSVFMSTVNNSKKDIKSPNDKETERDAKEVITNTVITSCIIQTSALPNRVEMEGNDITFYDDTYEENGQVKGDTSRLIFFSSYRDDGHFIMEKRASVNDTYDNVMSWYYTEPLPGKHNWLFIGRAGIDTPESKNLSVLRIGVNGEPTDVVAVGKPYGSFSIEYTEESINSKLPFFVGSSRNLIGSGLTGFSSFIQAGDGGVTGLAYDDAGTVLLLLYLLTKNEIMLGADLIPDTDGVYDIGSPTAKIATLYGSVMACPLPTWEDALVLLKKIPEPQIIEGGRGHYGDRLYFDDLTFPEELLFTDKRGRTDIEHNHMLGFLLKAVKELNAKVENLEAQLSAQ